MTAYNNYKLEIKPREGKESRHRSYLLYFNEFHLVYVILKVSEHLSFMKFLVDKAKRKETKAKKHMLISNNYKQQIK